MSLTPQKMFFTWKQRFHQVLFVILVIALCFSWQYVSSDEKTTTLVTCPVGIMGTSCSLCVTVRNCDLQKGNQLLAKAEAKLRECEMLTSTWIESSEISRLNRARAGERLVLSSFTVKFLKMAKDAFQKTDGAFDVTCGPLWFHWKKCEKEGRLPDREELELIRAESSWENLELLKETDESGDFQIVKRVDGVSVVTGGLAKGMAIDAALEILAEDEAVLSAFVEVGGDLATFHCSLPIKIDKPNDSGSSDSKESKAFRTIYLSDGGVCTSGHYARFFLINGEKFSQILNPKTGCPVPRQWTVTVTASCAAEADYWATALEVLGKDGISLLPEGVKAEFFEEKLP
ncbi:MAG: FAD:protein FMN transferase [Planctomycetaceae bacterium]|nr:FAD:protein FMN transferase [Planctomycetaceae bacterium]MBQ2822221.1 FAD:protein FMN transferase [Thermoguttaceae bacterium]